MKRQQSIIPLIALALLWSCSSKQICPEKINTLPMYGRVRKCEEQLKIDKDFIAECEKTFKDRKIATQYYLDKAWEYFYKNQHDTAMMRFNQAWLLDSANAEVYWGFGNVLGMNHQFKASIPLLQRSIELNPSNSKVYECISSSYGQLFFKTNELEYLNLNIENLKSSLRLDPSNATAYGNLACSYSYFNQKDSARKYLEITNRLDSNAIDPERRKMLFENLKGL